MTPEQDAIKQGDFYMGFVKDPENMSEFEQKSLAAFVYYRWKTIRSALEAK